MELIRVLLFGYFANSYFPVFLVCLLKFLLVSCPENSQQKQVMV